MWMSMSEIKMAEEKLVQLRSRATELLNVLQQQGSSGCVEPSWENCLQIMEMGDVIAQIRTLDRNPKSNKTILSPICFLCFASNKKLVDGHIASGAILIKHGIEKGVRTDGETFSTVQSQFFQEKMFCQTCDGSIIGNYIENMIMQNGVLLKFVGKHQGVALFVEKKTFNLEWEETATLLFRFAASTGLRVAHHCVFTDLMANPAVSQEEVFNAISRLRDCTKGLTIMQSEPFHVFYAVIGKDVQYAFERGTGKGVMLVPYKLPFEMAMRCAFLTWVFIGRIWIAVSLTPVPQCVKDVTMTGFTELRPFACFQLKVCETIPEFVGSAVDVKTKPDIQAMPAWQLKNAREAWQKTWDASKVIGFLENNFSFDKTAADPAERLRCPAEYEVDRCLHINEFGFEFNMYIKSRATNKVLKYICTRFDPTNQIIYVMDRDRANPALGLDQNFDWVVEEN